MRAISNSKIELMQYDNITALSSIEEQKEILKIKSERLANYIYSNLKETGIDKKEFLRLLIHDVISTEVIIKEIITKIETN